MPQYRKVPVIVDAFKIGVDSLPDWFDKLESEGKVKTYHLDLPPAVSLFNPGDKICADIFTPEGRLTALQGDYIVKGESEELGIHCWPVKPDYFEKAYELVK